MGKKNKDLISLMNSDTKVLTIVKKQTSSYCENNLTLNKLVMQIATLTDL